MQKKFVKVTAILTALFLVAMNVMPVAIYAAEEIQSTITSESNVEFNATVNGAYNARVESTDKAKLDFAVKVSNTGYVKDAVIEIENANYTLDKASAKGVKSIDGNKIYLNEVIAGEVLNASMNATFPEGDSLSKDMLARDSKATFKAVYVNSEGNEKKIEKSIDTNIAWEVNAKEQIALELDRYLKYDDKTMISFRVADGIEGNAIPYESKTIQVSIPKLAGEEPSKVMVSGADSYEYESGILTITQVNEPVDELYSKNTVSVEDVTLIYDVQASLSELKLQATAKVKTIADAELESKVSEAYEVSEEVGSIVRTEAQGSVISKGHLYANINAKQKLATAFSTKYSVNVALADLVDSITIEEADHKFNEELTQAVTSKKIIIDQDNFKKILGEDGEIIVKNTEDGVLGKLTSGVIAIEVEADYLKFEISKPIAEGTLEIRVDKQIRETASYSVEQIKSFNTLTTDVKITGSKEGNVISDQSIEATSKLEEPTSKADITASQNVLSTVVENNDVVFNVVLKTNEIADMLYSNPVVRISLPSQVSSINLTDAKLIYTDELEISSIYASGNEIIAEIAGNQTIYNSQITAVGPVLRVVANISLSDLTPSSQESGKLTVVNRANGEEVSKDFEMNIVAPTGFITLNKVQADGQVAEASEENREIKVSKGTTSAVFSQTVVNNLEQDAEGFAILGRIPAAGNKTIEGVDLGSNIDTSLVGEVTVSGIDAKVLYSDNVEEKLNGTWQETPTASSKSYKIEANGKVARGAKVTSSYQVAIPEGKEDIIARSSYGVYYNNNSTEGSKLNLVEAKSVGLYTEGKAIIETKVQAVNEHSNEEIANGAEVGEGEYIKYRVIIANNGSSTLENVKVTTNLPEGLNFMTIEKADSAAISGEFSRYQEDITSKSKTAEVGSIAKNETKTYEVIAKVYGSAEELKASFSISASRMDTPIVQEFTIKPVEGTIRADLMSSAEEVVEKDQEVTYRLELVNNTSNQIDNVKATLALPEGIEYVSSGDDNRISSSAHSVTIDVGTLKAGDNQIFRITTKVTSGLDKELTSRVTVTGNNIREVKSNEVSFRGQRSESGSSITATQTTNITGNSSDKDLIEFYVDIVNNSTSEKQVKFKDNIPDGLTVESYSLKIDGRTIASNQTSYIENTFTLPAGKTAKATIVASVDFLEEGKTASYTNKPAVLDLTTQTTINVNEVTVTVNGSGASTTNVANGSLRISGTAWIDANKDGKKDYNEGKVAGLEVMLYDLDNSRLAKSSKDKELRTTTDTNGTYTFEDLNEGNYVVVIKYDTTNYILTSYQASGLSLSENSDFIDAKLNDETVAASDTITLQASNVYNIDLGIAERSMFDLKLDKVITKITVSNTTNGNRVYEFNDNDVAKVELSTRNVENTTVLVEYRIKVTNEGKVAGYAKQIVDYIPAGMAFNSELNTTWYVAQDGNAYTTSLANTLIKPGETKEITLVLTKKMTGENVGTFRNTAEIAQSYNEQGYEDADSTPGNKVDGEDDMSSADAIILMSSGREAISITGIIVGTLAVIALAIYEIKKHVIYKVYDDMF